MRKNILFILTGGTISAQPSADGLVAGDITTTLAPILNSVTTDFDYTVQQLFEIDSTNMQPQHWVEIASCIQAHYKDYDAFIIVHGTDTMAYGSAALSYLIPNSAKPIIFTGSQVPLSQAGNDGVKNLINSVNYALSDDSYAVSVVFDGKAVVGTRARKLRTQSYNAFDTIDFANRAEIRLNKILPILRKPAKKAVNQVFYDNLNPAVVAIRLIPGMSGRILTLLAEEAEVLIIGGFGIGGIPENLDLGMRASLQNILAAGKRVILSTQVPMEGSDYQVYAVGALASDSPRLIEVKSITTEALVMKSMWALAEAGKDDVKFQELMQTTVDYDEI